MVVYIDDTYICSPTCADDVLLISFLTEELQIMMNTSDVYAIDHAYLLHPVNITVTDLVKAKGVLTTNIINRWSLRQTTVSQSDNFTHLGLTWTTGKTSPNVLQKISFANRTAYKLNLLMDKGVHGVSLYLFTTKPQSLLFPDISLLVTLLMEARLPTISQADNYTFLLVSFYL